MSDIFRNGRDSREFDFAKSALAQAIETETLNYACSPEDMQLIAKIGQRAVDEAKSRVGVTLQLLVVMQDIATAHCNGCPLKLLQLYMSDVGDFASDVTGIAVNLNRKNGQLMNGYRPIFAV